MLYIITCVAWPHVSWLLLWSLTKTVKTDALARLIVLFIIAFDVFQMILRWWQFMPLYDSFSLLQMMILTLNIVASWLVIDHVICYYVWHDLDDVTMMKINAVVVFPLLLLTIGRHANAFLFVVTLRSINWCVLDDVTMMKIDNIAW